MGEPVPFSFRFRQLSDGRAHVFRGELLRLPRVIPLSRATVGEMRPVDIMLLHDLRGVPVQDVKGLLVPKDPRRLLLVGAGDTVSTSLEIDVSVEGYLPDGRQIGDECV